MIEGWKAPARMHNIGAEIADRGINAVHLSWSISVSSFIMSSRLVPIVWVVWVTFSCMHAASIN
jgi:hypothetical protein